MVNYEFKPLPAPHDSVYIEASREDWGVYVRYYGSLAAMLSAGCITQPMADNFNEPSKGKGRFDAAGDEFWRRKRPTKAQPDRCDVIRMIHFDKGGEAKALALPGVADYLCEHESHEPSRIDTAAARVAEATGEDCSAKRTRAVGRFQRVVSWVSAGNLVFPDWPTIRGRTLAERLGVSP